MPTQPQRLIVLGLDGLSLDLARSLAATGRFPALARLLAFDAAALTAALPVACPVNRACLLTAAGPADHGIYGATVMDPAAYVPLPVTAADVRLPLLPERLAAAGLSYVTCGLPFPDAGASAGWEASAEDIPDCSAGAEAFRTALAAKREALDRLPALDDVDCSLIFLDGTQRFLLANLAAAADPAHTRHGQVLDLLADWDACLARVLDRYDALPGPKRLLCLADHGFTRLVSEVDLNAWLAEQGLLAAAPVADAPDRMRLLPHKTAAFALDGGRIHINIKERFARGVFHEHVAEKLAGELREALLALTCQGQPVMAAVHLGSELFGSPLPHRAPDLVCVGAPGVSLTARLDRPAVCGVYGATGCSTPHGAFFCDTQAQRPDGPVAVGRDIARFFRLPEARTRP